eukprot:CAMPEP_0197935172 /NCGR_PEP_ID=MMETSP1439-20131203/112883_1 /TAXON_ID=66791 /ORGANISM="Gonyaulax spinifera, Strain CCMP409" /LENGTH=305 /DNA_ID=CAMNT_0043558095 /DNA_START=23 /DNA_END=940 /DNA_ORIENTATION=-
MAVPQTRLPRAWRLVVACTAAALGLQAIQGGLQRCFSPVPGRRQFGQVARAATGGNGARSRPLSFLLARHGQTTFNAEKRFQGCLDEAPVLTERGVEQARQLGVWLHGNPGSGSPGPASAVGAVFCSPLLRARQTLEEARSVAVGLPTALTFPELREINLYEWEGRTQAEIRDEDPEAMRIWKEQAWNLRLGGGRPVVGDLWERASLAWRKMRQSTPSDADLALIVAHGTLGKALLSTALGLPVEAFRHFELANGEVVEVMWPAGSSDGEARWRKRHPQEGPWQSHDAEAILYADAKGAGSVDIA